ncbi:hypothetical protein A6F57_16515 [Alteromonas stellipolaris]|uniref:hypothetical protein n=1 Tax=Alteromonas stellipolaris TaxID=233316 RepID=UPI0007B44A7D|nr:hypothetical protein [Alteromonas stellipolaris]ANB26649.1 hypothetical protein A6F57_16515 [Alteromonas stellipolaris]
MNYRNPKKLERNVKASGVIRPLKIAFIVPGAISDESQKILDEVFRFSYAKWGGARYLLIPFQEDFIDSLFYEWLDIYDADIVYSYCTLPEEIIRKIERVNSPAYLIKHDFGNERRYIAVNIQHDIEPISSISCTHSPEIGAGGRSVVPNILCQHNPVDGDRFITDNFGNQTSLNNYLNPLSGLYETTCLTSEDTPANNFVGTHRIHSQTGAIEKLANNEVFTVSRLASIHSESVVSINSYSISNSFYIVVGQSVLDRINFWNTRHFHDVRNVTCCSLIVTSDQLLDDDFCREIGGYLNKQNFIGNNQRQVKLISSSVDNETLQQIRERLAEHTYNAISIAQEPDRLVAPSREDLRNCRNFYSDKFNLLISEDISEQVLPEPSHLRFVSPKFTSHGSGRFAVELLIDRHNSLSRYSNVVDGWLLPRRAYVSNIYGPKCIRVSKSNQLVYVGGNSTNIFGAFINNASSVEIHLPDDSDAINYLVVGRKYYWESDLRHELFPTNIEYITHSDKGQNFNGVVSMFGSLHDAANMLTNKLWRDVFKSIGEENQDFIFTHGKLSDFCPRDGETKNRIVEQLQLNSPKQASQYITAIFKDALEYLVQMEAVSPIYNWACGNCGHQNIRTVDKLKLNNSCDICRERHSMQIGDSFEWKYLLNKFIYKVLFVNSGLAVLWGLYQLQDMGRRHSFLYLPEVLLRYDHYDPNSKNEIDLIGVLDGQFFAGEVKRSADYFCNRQGEAEKFMAVIREVSPDVAILVFEQWSEEQGNIVQTKLQIEELKENFLNTFGGNIELRVLVFSELPRYHQLEDDFGIFGRHTSKLYDNWEKQRQQP